jgi:hypothetical protein
MKIEATRYIVSSFSFLDECDYPPIATNANKWRTKLIAIRFHRFRLEMNATILLSLLTWMNEERSYKRNSFNIFVSRWKRLSYITTAANEWRRKLYLTTVSFFSFRDEHDYPSIATNANEWRTNLQSRRFYLFDFEMNMTILLSLLTRMNEERSYKREGSIFLISRRTRLSFYHY